MINLILTLTHREDVAYKLSSPGLELNETNSSPLRGLFSDSDDQEENAEGSAEPLNRPFSKVAVCLSGVSDKVRLRNFMLDIC